MKKSQTNLVPADGKFPEWVQQSVRIGDELEKYANITFDEWTAIFDKSYEVKEYIIIIIKDSQLAPGEKDIKTAVNEQYIKKALAEVSKYQESFMKFTKKIANVKPELSPETIKWLNKAKSPANAKACLHAVIACWYIMQKESDNKTISKYFISANEIFYVQNEQDENYLEGLFDVSSGLYVWHAINSFINERKYKISKDEKYRLDKMRPKYAALFEVFSKKQSQLEGLPENVRNVTANLTDQLNNLDEWIKSYTKQLQEAKANNNTVQQIKILLSFINFYLLHDKLKAREDYKIAAEKLTLDLIDLTKVAFTLIDEKEECLSLLIEFMSTLHDIMNCHFSLLNKNISELKLTNAAEELYILKKISSLFGQILIEVKGDKCKASEQKKIFYDGLISTLEAKYKKLNADVRDEDIKGCFTYLFDKVFSEVMTKRIQAEEQRKEILARKLQEELQRKEERIKEKLKRKNNTNEIIPFYISVSDVAEGNASLTENQKKKPDQASQKTEESNWKVQCVAAYERLYTISLIVRDPKSSYEVCQHHVPHCEESLNNYFIAKNLSATPTEKAAALSGLAWGNLLLAKLYRKLGDSQKMQIHITCASDNLKLATAVLFEINPAAISDEQVNLFYFLNDEAKNLLDDIKKFQLELKTVSTQRQVWEARLQELLSEKDGAVSFFGPKYLWLSLKGETEFKGPYNFIVREKLLEEIKNYPEYAHMSTEEIAKTGWRKNPNLQKSVKGQKRTAEVNAIKAAIRSDITEQFNQCHELLQSLTVLEENCTEMVKGFEKYKYRLLLPNRTPEEINGLFTSSQPAAIQSNNDASTLISILSPISPREQGYSYGFSGLPLDAKIKIENLEGLEYEWYQGYELGKKEYMDINFPPLPNMNTDPSAQLTYRY